MSSKGWMTANRVSAAHFVFFMLMLAAPAHAATLDGLCQETDCDAQVLGVSAPDVHASQFVTFEGRLAGIRVPIGIADDGSHFLASYQGGTNRQGLLIKVSADGKKP